LVVVMVLSYLLGATLPDGSSLAWPLFAFVIVAAGMVVRYQAITTLDRAARNQMQPPWFNGDLKTRPGQSVVTSGPYRFVRHPGYSGSFAILLGLALMTALWPFLLVAVVALCLAFWRRLRDEEPINRATIAGYEAYSATHRWRMVPGIW
jgi:protein-S-isoprenylcysteine O-methyltransferase Ste14